MYPSAMDLSPPVRFVDDVTPILLDWHRAGLRGVLVTLVGIEGASPRPLGSQLAVNERGDWVGQISSDCAEAAIAREALACLADGKARTVRYGRGSKYMDLRLPCGSGLDIHFDPDIPRSVLEALEDKRRARRPVALVFALRGNGANHRIETLAHGQADGGSEFDPADDAFIRSYLPQTRVVVAGRGAYASALVSFAHALGWEACLLTPDLALIEQHAHQCLVTRKLAGASDFDASLIDPWTATVLLFHDHRWEPAILAQVLQADGFYVGALGSRATHHRRFKELARLGVGKEQFSRVRGPAGLDVGARTPPEIALSIAGEIVAARRLSP
ncbi:MAG: XdhC family protein [Hyphomicrobiaceae bacterium]